ncbi:hypothetical protein CUMW_276890 [Citrus unshiu]|uniref:Uncharacterized protein n=1 Tax=Citrus unshiu TaxID=55188 RepID=A0A2H5N3L7_CITUN|nr:hypothetical protein CUMW_276890 [Citrus unshiu]
MNYVQEKNCTAGSEEFHGFWCGTRLCGTDSKASMEQFLSSLLSYNTYSWSIIPKGGMAFERPLAHIPTWTSHSNS